MAGEAAQQAGAKPETTEAIVDIVGDVLDQMARRRAERQAAEAADGPAAQPAPPRRGRLLQRLRQGAGAGEPAAGQPADAAAPASSQ